MRRGGAGTLRSGDLRMGQPRTGRCDRTMCAEGTGGTETSHVPRGRERIPVVVANEPGRAQTRAAHEAAAAAAGGLNAMPGGASRPLARAWSVSRTALEGPAGAGESPVGDDRGCRVRHEREYCRTREIRWEAGSPTTQG